MQAEDKKMSRLLKGALSHPDRKAILDCLIGSAEGMSERELADVLDLDPAKASYHLKVLRDANLVMQIEEGQEHGKRAYVAAGR
jgi:DNA-binding transcriptional ArsR family regulator